MHELFYVEAGRGVFMINDLPHVVGNGSFVHVRFPLGLFVCAHACVFLFVFGVLLACSDSDGMCRVCLSIFQR